MSPFWYATVLVNLFLNCQRLHLKACDGKNEEKGKFSYSVCNRVPFPSNVESKNLTSS